MANTKADKVRYAIEHDPTLIKTLLRDTSINKGMIKRMLYKTLPCRIGIEFELGERFAYGFSKKYHREKVSNETLTKYYKVKEIREDSIPLKTPIKVCPIIGTPLGDPPINEIRISLEDYHQLNGLYKFMRDLNEFCKLHEGGGIHIHIDLTKYPYWRSSEKSKELKNYITKRLDEIGRNFPKYKGSYNKKRVGLEQKGSWVNLSRLHTIEFRTMPLTFDYTTIIQWIKFISKFRQVLICDCNLVNNKTFRAFNAKNKDVLQELDIEAADIISDTILTSDTSSANPYSIEIINSGTTGLHSINGNDFHTYNAVSSNGEGEETIWVL